MSADEQSNSVPPSSGNPRSGVDRDLSPPWPPQDEEVADVLRAAIADGSWGRYHGPHGPRLTAELAQFLHSEFVFLCCSGTFAVQLALRALRIEPGDEVLLAGYDFPGNFRSIEALGAVPVLVDVDERNWNLAPENLAAAWSPRTRGVLVSHLHGGLVPMRQLCDWARERQLGVIEDVCQAPGAVVEGRPAGTWGDVGVLSFGGSKLLSAGRGGAIFTSQPQIHQRAKVFCEQGNHAFPLSELQAAILVPQVARLPQHNRRRAQSVALLRHELAALSCLRFFENPVASSAAVFYKVGMQFDASAAGCSRETFIESAQAAGLAIDTGFRGFLHRGPRRCRRGGELIESDRAAHGVVLLHHPVLLQDEETIRHCAQTLRQVCARLRAEEPR